MICKATWLSTLALAGLAACSGEGSGAMPRPVNNTAPIANNLPPGDSEMAPADDQAPPGAEESVSEGASVGGTDALLAACTAACSVPVSGPCSQEPDCVSECLAGSEETGACASQYLAFIQCMARQSQLGCEVDEEESYIAMPGECQASQRAMTACLRSGESTARPIPGCTRAGGCVCDDPCETCLCSMDDDSVCDVFCE